MIVRTTSADSVKVIRNLEFKHLWYYRTTNENIQEKYGFRYLGELLERFEDRAGSDIRDILQDPFIRTLYPKEELRGVYDMVCDPKTLGECSRELKRIFLSDAELQAEKDADEARKKEQEQLAREKENTERQAEFNSIFDGSFNSLLKYLDKHK